MHSIASRYALVFAIIAVGQAWQSAASSECGDGSDCRDQARLEELAQARTGFREAIVIGEFGEAEILAKRAVELSIDLNGRDSVHTANAMTNLAYVQYRLEQYENSRLNLLAAIQTIEQVAGKLSPDLIQPLNRLGHTESALGELGSATRSFQRAVHISHVHSGPQNTGQIDSLEAIADIHLRRDDIEEARNIQRRILAYRARADGTDSAAYAPALAHYADWMRKLGLYNSETNTYLDLLEIQEDNLGPAHPDLIPTLLRLAFSQHEGSSSNLDDHHVRRVRSPDTYLGRAMDIAENHPESDWQLFAQTALTAGDYFTLRQRVGLARAAYRDAWQQLSLDPSGISRRNEELGTPRLLVMPALPRFYEGEDPLPEPDAADDFLRGTITAEFGVTKTGEPVGIRLVETQPAGLAKIERRLMSSLRSMMHRPRMEVGQLVDTEQMTYVYEFFYRENDR